MHIGSVSYKNMHTIVHITGKITKNMHVLSQQGVPLTPYVAPVRKSPKAAGITTGGSF